MERPRCGTCPHMVKVTLGNEGDYQCRRWPPDSHFSRGVFIRSWPSVYPWFEEGCGEHPDFPAYAASLRVQAETPSDGGPK